MFDKIIHLEPHFSTGELSVQPAMLWVNGKAVRESFTKYASEECYNFFKTITPVPGHSFVYMIALGAWETYGENRNGDSFPEFPYKENANPPGISATDILPLHYKSFEVFGKNYRHHVNKDPEKAVGDIVRAFWNAKMHRVELLVDVNNAKAPDLADRLASGEFPPVSMGTRVAYDVCSICLNRAPTRLQYCDHLKYKMRDVINGMKVSALNPSPKFFDISWIIKPADQTAWTMKKVAGAAEAYSLISGSEAGEYIQKMSAFKRAAQKMADLDKIVRGIPLDSKSTPLTPLEVNSLQQMRQTAAELSQETPPLPDSFLQSAAGNYTIPEITSSLMASGMMSMSTPEFTKVIIFKSAPTAQIDPWILQRISALQPVIFKMLSLFPQLLDQISDHPILSAGEEHVIPELMKCCSQLKEKQAGVSDYLYRKIVPLNMQEYPGYNSPLTLTDPATGVNYRTNRKAAVLAHDEIAKRNIYKILGGAAVLGGGYKLMAHGLLSKGLGKLRPLAAAGLGTVGLINLPSMGPHYMTDQGIPIPTMTELAKTSAFNPIKVMVSLNSDYSWGYPTEKNAGFKTAGGLNNDSNLLNFMAKFANSMTDTVVLPTINIDKLASMLGQIIFDGGILL